MQGLYLLCFVVATTICLGHSQFINCTGRPDNPNTPDEVTCYSKTYCMNEVETTDNCSNGEVMERETYSCKDPAIAYTACGTTPNCTGKLDGIKYGDIIPNCHTFYFCRDKKFLDRQYCPAPRVWDSYKNYCNWVWAVPPPCGTALPRP